MRAFVSDQSSSFNAKVIGGPPNSTVVASLELPPGSWVVFATVALAGNAAPGTTASVQMFFQLDGMIPNIGWVEVPASVVRGSFTWRTALARGDISKINEHLDYLLNLFGINLDRQ